MALVKENLLYWNPEDYAKNSSAQLGWAKELIARLALRGDEALLDVGCGRWQDHRRVCQERAVWVRARRG